MESFNQHSTNENALENAAFRLILFCSSIVYLGVFTYGYSVENFFIIKLFTGALILSSIVVFSIKKFL